MATSSLISVQNRVESPFIILKIGKYTFGHCASPKDKYLLKSFNITYPNYLTRLTVKKINGAVNTYTINMTYAITESDDPNMLEKVFSSISDNRIIKISYGDWSAPSYIYKEEEAILTKIGSNVDFMNSKIEYTLNATSNALSATSILHDFSASFSKPSDLIKKILKDTKYNLTDIFYGMLNLDDGDLNNLIDSSDKAVKINAQKNMSVLNYINYLVTCMTAMEDKGSDLKTSKYFWATYDDINNEYNGPYFKVVKVNTASQYSQAYDTYEVDIGYPSGNYVSSFTLDNNESWSILYKYSKDIPASNYTYDIDEKGNLNSTYSPMILKSENYGTVTEGSKAWWSSMTQYPISAKLTIKGLLRPALLMSYVRINTYFYGHKHISSGLYIIVKQEDTIDSSGYKTTLSITRINGD